MSKKSKFLMVKNEWAESELIGGEKLTCNTKLFAPVDKINRLGLTSRVRSDGYEELLLEIWIEGWDVVWVKEEDFIGEILDELGVLQG